jgi:paraquat-inducible protein B
MTNNELAIGVRKEKKSISLVWVAPIVALLITAGMIWKNYIDAGTRITIVIENGDGIRSGKTPIMYKGINIGVVEDIQIKKDDVSKLEIIALIDKKAADKVTRKGNKFWKVEPKISLTEVSGLNTIVSGIYISVMPAANTKEQLLALPFEDHFVALSSPPINVFNPGLSVIVNTVNKGDISIGAPVLFNKQAIGKVENKKLSDDKKSIDIYLRIETKYMDLVHEESLFYKVDALDVQASLSGVKVKMGSFASFIAGGIAMHNSDSCFSSPVTSDKTRFHLYDSYNEIMLSDEEILLIMDEHNLLEPDNTKLFYKGVEAGIVKSIVFDPVKNKTKIKIKVHNDFREFANEKAYFWIVKPQLDFNSVDGLDAVLKGNYINFISKDVNAKTQSSFILHEKAPQKDGVPVRLIAQEIKTLQEGAGLYYHGVKIGIVSSYRINKDNKSFIVDLILEPRYKRLINTSSAFYHMDGIELKADFNGVDLKTGSLESIVRGGIAVETPDFKADKGLAKEYKLYSSYSDLSKVRYLSAEGLYLTLMAEELGSLKKGSPVYFKQIKVGEVVSYRWDSQRKKVLLELFIVKEYAKEVHDNSLFYNASGVDAKFDLSGFEINTESLETIITGGIAFYTPLSQVSTLARDHEQFKLYDTKAKAMNQYTDITLFSKDSYGLITGNLVMYKSVIIGHVENVSLVKEGVELDIKVDSKYRYLMREDTLFWTESFEMSLQGIENFSAALKGNFIVLKPGISEKMKDYYHLLSKAPSAHLNEEGLRVVVQAQRLGSIKEGTPVYYRQIRIGSAIQYRLNDDATGVDIELFIEPCYAHLIRSNSYFYNASGIGMQVSLLSAKIQTETLDSILTGGIGVLTPDDYTAQAEKAQLFKLHEDFDENALRWAPKLRSSDPMCQ